jgi:putative ABC transport system permease protein
MLKNYFLVAWRNILRNKVFSCINILGLAIGLAACFMIYQYVRFERSYDTFHENSDRLYRVPISYSGSFSSVPPTAANHPAVGPAMKADFPGVEDFGRMVRSSLFINGVQLSYLGDPSNPVSFKEERMYLADASMLTMFSFRFVEGDPKTALREPRSVVITERTAKKYFGNDPGLGKDLNLNAELNLKVTGILKDIPQNSHLQFDVLVSFSTLGDKWGYDAWTWPEFYNYVLLSRNADPKAIEAEFPAFIEKYLGEIQKQNNFQSHFTLQPITDIHLKSHLLLEQSANGNERTVYFLSILAIFILLVAWINYVNLSTAKSLERSKEVGLRKVAGANRRQLVLQFFFDALLINVLGAVIAVAMVGMAWVPFEQLAGVTIPNPFSGEGNAWNQWQFACFVFLVGILVVGTYPALLLSSFNPAMVLKGKFYKSRFGITLRRSLVSFQFILALLLIAGSMTIYEQLNFMRTQDLGYDKEQILVVRGPAVFDDETVDGRSKFFKDQLAGLPGISGVTASSDIPGEDVKGRNQVRRANQDVGDGFVAYWMTVDNNYISTYALEVRAGRAFAESDESKTFEGDQDVPVKVMVNELLCNQLGFTQPEDAVNERIIFRLGNNNVPAQIIGVLRNYHQVSLRENFEPILYFYPSSNNWKCFSVNVNPKELPMTLATIKNAYAEAFPNNTFDYFFLDDHFDRQYRADDQFGKVFSVFTVLAVIVAGLGLLGLSIFTVNQRIKEVGIRKVLGASAMRILVLFSKDFLKILLLSYVIVVPVVWYTAKRWLESFSFRAPLSWEIFVMPPLLLMLITLATIISISLKSALSNPVKSLRYE